MRVYSSVAEMVDAYPLHGEVGFVTETGKTGHFMFDSGLDPQEADEGVTFPATGRPHGMWCRVLPHIGTVISTWYPSLQKALDAGYARVQIPTGVYHFADSVYIRNGPLILEGDGGQRRRKTELRFQQGGLVIQHSAEQSVVRDLAVIGEPGHTGDTFTLQGRADVERVYCWTAGRYGFYVDGTEPYNTNSTRMVNCGVFSCGSDGVRIEGRDGNAGVFELMDSEYNVGTGITDNSFLGNLHLGHHVAINQDASFRAINPASRSLWVRPYSEEGDEPTEVNHPSMIIGGNFAGGQDSPKGDGLIWFDKLRLSPQLTVVSTNSNKTDQTQVTVGGSDGRTVLSWTMLKDRFFRPVSTAFDSSTQLGKHNLWQSLLHYGPLRRWVIGRANSALPQHTTLSFDDSNFSTDSSARMQVYDAQNRPYSTLP